MSRARFDPELLDPSDPFEIDDANRPHLAKHSRHTDADLLDLWGDGNLLFAEAAADGPADWILIAALPGGEVIQVPLAPPRRGDWSRCRPIGIYPANQSQQRLYREHSR
ncbi:MAG: hypothetical protein ACRD0A_02540 [Acidimicrobiales bacterium]